MSKHPQDQPSAPKGKVIHEQKLPSGKVIQYRTVNLPIQPRPVSPRNK